MEELFTTLLSVAAHAQAECDIELQNKVQETMISAMIEVPSAGEYILIQQHARELITHDMHGTLTSGKLGVGS